MKLRFALILLFWVLTSCGPKQAWTSLGDFDGGTTYYLLSKTEKINSDPKYIGGSVRWIYAHPQQLITENSSIIYYTSKEATVILNCTAHTFAMPDYSLLNHSEVVKWTSEDPNKVKWIDIEADEAIKELAGKPCSL